MKFLIILTILYSGDVDLTTYEYGFKKFIDKNTCEQYLKQESTYLEYTMYKQFTDKNIEYAQMECWENVKWLEHIESLKNSLEV
jgi:hypothetical protein|tara:strand:+ start:121 stop:372 length:252 start_codon:yes stop_codon:yes gene_type:complete